MANFRVWRKEKCEFEFFAVGDAANFCDGDAIQLGSGFITKSGVEVYEGDMVTGDKRGTKDWVIFTNGCFCLQNAISYYEATYWGKEIEVIGNNFEGEK